MLWDVWIVGIMVFMAVLMGWGAIELTELNVPTRLGAITIAFLFAWAVLKWFQDRRSYTHVVLAADAISIMNRTVTLAEFALPSDVAEGELLPGYTRKQPFLQLTLRRDGDSFLLSTWAFRNGSSLRDDLAGIVGLEMEGNRMELHDLIVQGDLDKLAEFLETSQLDLNQPDERGWTPLTLACEHDQFAVVRLLVENGADVNQAGCAGQSPLHYAVDTAIDPNCHHELGRRVDDAPVDIVVYLLWKGADPLQKADNGESSIDWAKEGGVDKIADLLQRYVKRP